MNESLYREVDEEVRRERLVGLWKRYGPWAIGGALAIILGVSGYIGWGEYVDSQRRAESATFVNALDLVDQGQRDAAIEALARLQQETDSGYAGLAGLERAALLVQDDRFEEAAAVYEEVNRQTTTQHMRDLSSLLAGLSWLEAGNPDQAEAHLQTAARPDSTFRYSAREMLGVLSYQRGDRDAAAAYYNELLADTGTPQGIQQRASEMLDLLESEGVRVSPNAPVSDGGEQAPTEESAADGLRLDDDDGASTDNPEGRQQ